MEHKQRYWWKNAKIYELYIDKFAGNIAGLTARLPYFNSLGINALHILPHFPSPMVDDGYDITDYRGVREELGTLEDFAELVREAHAHGIRIIIDFVLNHTSAEHPWFIEARSSKNNPKRDFYHWSETGKEFEGSLNAFPDIKPSNWVRNSATNDHYFATFYPGQPDLNWDNPEVFSEMVANMEFWAEMGVDGFRLDAAGFLIKREGTNSRGLPETHAVVKKIRAQLEANYPDVILLGEAAQNIEEAREYFGDGDECHLIYHFPLMAQKWHALQYGDPATVHAMIKDTEDIPENCEWAVFLRNHDEIELRFLRDDLLLNILEWLDPKKEYIMNKGQATAKRVASIFDGDPEKILTAFKLLYSVPGAPVMYYGDEIGMQNLPLEEAIIDTRKYVRGQFDWTEAEKQMEDPLSLWSKTAEIIQSPAPALEETGEEATVTV